MSFTDPYIPSPTSGNTGNWGTDHHHWLTGLAVILEEGFGEWWQKQNCWGREDRMELMH